MSKDSQQKSKEKLFLYFSFFKKHFVWFSNQFKRQPRLYWIFFIKMYNFNRFHTASSLPENEEKKNFKINMFRQICTIKKISRMAKMCVDQNVYAYIYIYEYKFLRNTIKNIYIYYNLLKCLQKKRSLFERRVSCSSVFCFLVCHLSNGK